MAENTTDNPPVIIWGILHILTIDIESSNCIAHCVVWSSSSTGHSRKAWDQGKPRPSPTESEATRCGTLGWSMCLEKLGKHDTKWFELLSALSLFFTWSSLLFPCLAIPTLPFFPFPPCFALTILSVLSFSNLSLPVYKTPTIHLLHSFVPLASSPIMLLWHTRVSLCWCAPCYSHRPQRRWSKKCKPCHHWSAPQLCVPSLLINLLLAEHREGSHSPTKKCGVMWITPLFVDYELKRTGQSKQSSFTKQRKACLTLRWSNIEIIPRRRNTRVCFQPQLFHLSKNQQKTSKDLYTGSL